MPSNGGVVTALRPKRIILAPWNAVTFNTLLAACGGVAMKRMRVFVHFVRIIQLGRIAAPFANSIATCTCVVEQAHLTGATSSVSVL